MKLIKTEKVNTCNAWGFGGWIGKRETFENGLIIETGKQMYRHQKPDSFKKYLVEYNETKWSTRNDLKPSHKFVLIYHCVTPEFTHYKAAQFTETDIEPFSMVHEPTKTKLDWEIVKIIKL